MRVAIIGAGTSGLALAYYLQKLGVRYDLFEASAEVGGAIKSSQKMSYQLELGPTFLQMCEEMEELLLELKLQDDVLLPASEARLHHYWRNGTLYPLSDTPLNLLSNSFYKEETEHILKQEYERPFREVPEETISQFFTRRFGQEVVDYLVEPFVASTHAGNPDVLLLEKTFPHLKEWERTHGSVLAGLQTEDLPALPNFTLAKGLQSLPKAIASKLISLHLEHEVEMVHRSKGKYFLSIAHDVEGLSDEEYDAVVLALPAHPAAELLNFVAPGLSAVLQNVNYAPLTVVHSIYRKLDIGVPLDGLGALHPKKENLFSTATFWTSSSFPHCSPKHEMLFTTLVGGTQCNGQAQLSREEILKRVHQELKSQYQISADVPLYQHSQFWPQAIPQADVFIQDVHAMASLLEEERLYSCVNWIAGPSVPECVRYAKQLAQKIYSQRPSFQ